MATAEEDGSLVCCDERRALRAELAEVRAQIQILKGEALIKGGSNRLLREELADLHSRIRELLGTRELVAYISAERVAALLPPVEGSEPHAEDLRSSAEQLIPVESTAPTEEEK